MSREIKFRAWDKHYKRFRDIALSSPISALNNNEIDERFELTQYTGLKDKNGKEVYEGDIIKYSSDVINSFYRVNEIFREVRFKYGMYGIKGIEDGTHIPFGNILKCQYEVIGNIYENPNFIGGEVNES